jgi:hypothetical protein
MSSLSPGLDWSASMDKHKANPLSCSSSGAFYGPLGCFPIGLNVSEDDFEHVLGSQRRLRSMNLLSKLPSKQLHDIANLLSNYSASDSRPLDIVPSSREAVMMLADALARTNDEMDDPYQIQIYTGLDSGFHTPSGGQFWAIWELVPRTSSLVIYISKSVQNIPAVLLHTYCSRSSFSRYQSFLVEYGLSEFENKTGPLERLPARMEQDLNLLSSSELLLYLQHLQFSDWDDGCPLLSSLRTQCEELLIDVPTYRQLKKLSNMEYISGTITDEHLVNSRLKWYRLCHLPCLDKFKALELFRHIDFNFRSLLWDRAHEDLEIITLAIERLTSRNSIDSVSDFLLFCIFCAARKAGFEEVYIEVSDRNPLFNQYSDQSAAFAELFALGSRCEAYFDITPSDIGILLSKKHRDYYNDADHQPPMWIFNAPSFASAYAAAQTDIDPDQKASVIPGYRRFTFLSVFAIPALVGRWPLCNKSCKDSSDVLRHHAPVNYWARIVP